MSDGIAQSKSAQKLAVCLPINAAGHFQGLLAIANRLRQDHQIRCVFIVAGPPPQSRLVQDQGHELLELPDLAPPIWDFEIELGEDLSRPMSESEESLRLKQGKEKVPFRGAARWPQIIARNQFKFRVEPKQTFEPISQIFSYCLEYCLANSQQIDEKLDSLKPDLIICDSFFTQPSILKNQNTRPWVRVWSSNPMEILIPKAPAPPHDLGYKLYSKEERARMQRDEPETWQRISNDWARARLEVEKASNTVLMKMRDFYIANGCGELLKRVTEANRIESPHLNIYMFPQAIDYDQDDDLFEYPARWLRCDSLIRKSYEENDGENAFWRDQIEKKMREQKLDSIVYFSLGSVASGEPSLMQRFVEYLAGDNSNRLYLVSKGVNGDQVKLADRNMLGANYLPQTFLLRLSHLAIIHGGNNSLTETLFFGLPMIILPAFKDQFDNAQRVEDLALGKRLDLHNCTRDELLTSIDELINNRELLQKAREIGQAMQNRDDLGKVSRIIWELIEKRTLPSETAQKFGVKL